MPPTDQLASKQVYCIWTKNRRGRLEILHLVNGSNKTVFDVQYRHVLSPIAELIIIKRMHFVDRHTLRIFSMWCKFPLDRNKWWNGAFWISCTQQTKRNHLKTLHLINSCASHFYKSACITITEYCTQCNRVVFLPALVHES